MYIFGAKSPAFRRSSLMSSLLLPVIDVMADTRRQNGATKCAVNAKIDFLGL